MLLPLLSEKVGAVFASFGLDQSLGAMRISNRPDLSDFQCNGALAAAKALKRNPVELAKEIAPALEKLGLFSSITIDGPGFINFKIANRFLIDYFLDPTRDQTPAHAPQKILIDFGGPNVAKPLHVGHLRSAIIGESLKRISRAMGHEVVGDIHLGDWGTPMGMLIAQLSLDHPEWPFFSESFDEKAASVRPDLTADTLNSLYPVAAKHFKDDPAFADMAREATTKLQNGHPGYRKLWRHFVDISIESIKADFDALGVSFDLWLGESDADAYMQAVFETMAARNLVKESDGALIVEVAEPEDKHEVPPVILRKKDGAANYATTDLATIAQRVKDYNPEKILYVVDQRQSLHFKQVFRAAAKAGLARPEILEHIGFGTVNGKDGKPFKTREGGVMRLSDLIQISIDLALKESGFADENLDETTKEMVTQIAIAAIKFGDLSNPRTSDYIFDPTAFVRFDGKTGPYIQYAVVRAESVLEKTDVSQIGVPAALADFSNETERDLVLNLLRYPEALQSAFDKRLPSELCEYAYNLARSFSVFYKKSAILVESDAQIRQFRLFLTQQTARTLKKVLDCLAIPTPRKMLRAPKAEDVTEEA